VTSFDSFQRRSGVTDLKNAMRERDRSSPGEREEAKMDRSTAGVTGMRLGLWGLSTAPGSVGSPPANDVRAAAPLACAADAESGYGRCEEEETSVGDDDVETVAVAAAYVAGVMVHVLGVELVGVRLEVELLERTEDEGEATIVRVVYCRRIV
jgi:hypothetical protein